MADLQLWRTWWHRVVAIVAASAAATCPTAHCIYLLIELHRAPLSGTTRDGRSSIVMRCFGLVRGKFARADAAEGPSSGNFIYIWTRDNGPQKPRRQSMTVIAIALTTGNATMTISRKMSRVHESGQRVSSVAISCARRVIVMLCLKRGPFCWSTRHSFEPEVSLDRRE
jgi:hypothetical protein